MRGLFLPVIEVSCVACDLIVSLVDDLSVTAPVEGLHIPVGVEVAVDDVLVGKTEVGMVDTGVFKDARREEVIGELGISVELQLTAFAGRLYKESGSYSACCRKHRASSSG